MSKSFEELIQEGWRCPICKRVYSPYTPMCYYCGFGEQTTVTSTGTNISPGYMTPVTYCESSKTIPNDDKTTTRGR